MFKLHDVLYVPKLSYNLLSVSKAAGAGKVTQLNEDKCEIIGVNQRVIAVAIRLRSLYYLDCNAQTVNQEINITERQERKECLWHQCFGHLEMKNLQKMSKGNLVSSFSFDIKRKIDFVIHA